MREAGVLRHLEGALELILRLVILPHLDEDGSLGLKVARHRRNVARLLPQSVLLVHVRKRLIHLAAVNVNDRLAEERGAALAVAPGLVVDFL